MTTRSLPRTLIALALIASLSACGGDDAPGPANNEAAAKARLEELFKLVKASDRASAARIIVYRGEDKERSWKDVSDYTRESDKARVDEVFRKVEQLLKAGEPTFVKYHEEKESEGTWLVWDVQFGSRKASMAMLEVAGQPALGDVD